MDSGFLHHAYLLEGDQSDSEILLDSWLESLGFPTKQNPDYHLFLRDSFSVDDSRNIREMVSNKAFGSKKIFVLSAGRFSEQAQNALLKTFEEPTENTHFFILLPLRDMLMSTLLSRLEIVRVNSSDTETVKRDKSKPEIEKFLTSSPADRLSWVKKFIDKHKNDSDPRAFLSPFLNALLDRLRAKGAHLEDEKQVLISQKFSDDQAVMPRLILEHLAVVLK